jgi:hypothetical protein
MRIVSLLSILFVFGCTQTTTPKLPPSTPETMKAIASVNNLLVRVNDGTSIGSLINAFGTTVNIVSVTPQTMCNVVFIAPGDNRPSLSTKVSDFISDALKIDNPGLPNYPDGFVWNALVRSEGCLYAPKEIGYLGSSMYEFLKLDATTKARFLKIEGTCLIDDKQVPCSVPFGSSNANSNGKVSFPMEWFGMGKLNF